MKTVENTIEVNPDESVVAARMHPAKLNDTKTVVVAVGAAVILFIVGLILGYLLGHNSARSYSPMQDRDGYGMMQGGNTQRGGFPMYRGGQTGTSSSTQQNTTTQPQAQTQ